jgi:hypothetical protein
MKDGIIRAYSGYNIGNIQKRLLDIASLIKGMSRKSASVIDSTYCINKATYYTECFKKSFTILKEYTGCFTTRA